MCGQTTCRPQGWQGGLDGRERLAAPSPRDSSIAVSGRGTSRLQLSNLEEEESFVQPSRRQQVRMRSTLHDTTVVHHQDFGGLNDGTESVGDGNRSPPGHYLGDGELNLGLQLAVHRT